MQPLLRRLTRALPAFALPFVTRSLRGTRARRHVALSLLLTALTLLFGLWVGLGRGPAARDARIALGVEQHSSVREQFEFVIVRSAWDDRRILEMRVESLESHGRQLVHMAASSPWGGELYERTRELDAALPMSAAEQEFAMGGFAWGDPYQVARLRHVVDAQGEVEIVDYEPATDLRATIDLLGMFAGGLLIAIGLVVAPLLVAVQQASERHENTLQPLTGTGLRAHELALGMACGPLSVAAIYAAPLALVFGFASVRHPEALLLFPALAASSVGVVFGAQLLAHMLGARRAPGMVAVALLGVLTMVAFVGIGFAAELERETYGLPALLPHAAVFALLADAFGEPWLAARPPYWSPLRGPAFPLDIMPAFLVGLAGAAALGSVALHALARHIEGRAVLLRAHHATLAALVCTVMVAFAIPDTHGSEPLHVVLGLPTLALPFMLIVMGRVPLGDMPTKLRRIPLGRLVLEFGAAVAVYLAVAVVLDGSPEVLHPLTLAGFAWCSLVLVLIAVRTVATPSGILAHGWAFACMAVVPFTFGLGLLPAFEGVDELARALTSAPAFLSLAWLILLVVVPATLLAHLRRHVGRVE